MVDRIPPRASVLIIKTVCKSDANLLRSLAHGFEISLDRRSGLAANGAWLVEKANVTLAILMTNHGSLFLKTSHRRVSLRSTR